LRLTRDSNYVDDDGDSPSHLRGVINPTQAVLDLLRAELESLNASLFDMAAQDLEDSVRFYDANPAPIEIWLSPDGLPVRIVLDQDASHSQGTARVDARLSRFNAVSVDVPTDYIPLSTPTPTP
jgi:hypothetical protein